VDYLATFQNIAYIVSAVLFIVGIKTMARPRTAVVGNLLSAGGMAVAVGAALLNLENYYFIIAGMLIGGAVGAALATYIEITSMPELVAAFNGLGGAASVLVAGAFLPQEAWDVLLATGVSGVIGAVTFWGSLVAWGKLRGVAFFTKPIPLPGLKVITAVLVGVVVLMTLLMTVWGSGYTGVALFVLIVILSSVLGVLLVSPIGGADMPVVIALLNSYSGLAAAATGFVINNNALIISGSLVGASGIILSNLMCKAMNRSLINVLFGGIDSSSVLADADEIYQTVRSTSADDVAMLLETAQRVVVVPGYGMAVAQAQHAVRDLAKLLEANGSKVEYAIHPVAGRMPGHMNVLLAEVDVPYEKMIEMDAINQTMETVDVGIVIGANDVVNPSARTDPDSPIAGMPVINIDQARTVIVIKRSLSPGFAGIPNPLFAAENTLMLFGDAQKAVLDIVSAVKEG